jgi:hypothetical protein
MLAYSFPSLKVISLEYHPLSLSLSEICICLKYGILTFGVQVCPICASVPGGEPNLVTDDLAAHLTVEHRQQARDGKP